MFRRYLLGFQPLLDTPGDGGGGGGDLDELSQDLSDLGEETPPKGKKDEEEEESSDGDDDSDDSGDEEGSGEEDDDESSDDESGEEEEEEGEEDGEEEEEEEGKGKKAKESDEQDEYGRPTVKSIKSKYPNLFKEFPYLKTAFFEHSKYAEVFSDPDSAVDAANKAREFDALEATLVSQGDPSLLVKTLSENNPKALKKVVENFAEAVREVDSDLFVQLGTPIIEELIYHASNHGTKTGNKNLVLAARHLANYVFANGGEIPDISKRKGSKKEEKSESEKQLEVERAEFSKREFNRAAEEIEGSLDEELRAVIGKKSKLDGLTSFERKQVIKEARAEVNRRLLNDKILQNKLTALWKKAAEDGYSDVSKTRIRRVWLDRARAIAPGIRNRLRQEALGGRKGERTPPEGDSNQQGKKRQFPSSGARGRGQRAAGLVDPKKIDWRKTSDMDILNS
jgi:hypothetical protein